MQNMHLLLVPQSQLQNVTVTKMTWFLVGSSGLEQWPLPQVPRHRQPLHIQIRKSACNLNVI